MTPLPAPRVVDCAGATARIFDHGAHLVSWVPDGQGEVIFLSSAAVFDTAHAIRGGVPICFPWFGPGRTGDQRPAHGFARLSDWTLTSVADGPDARTITYALTHVDDASSYEVTYRVRVGARLELEFDVLNSGSTDVSYEVALHAYLEVGDVERVTVTGLEGVDYLDKTADGARVTQKGAIVVDSETDRVYFSPGPVEVVDPVLRRRIRVTRSNSANVVVWNPWSGRAAEIADLGAGEWRRFLCVEGANVLEDAVRLAPGQRHVMGYRIDVDSVQGDVATSAL